MSNYDPSTKSVADLESDLMLAANQMERTGLEWAESWSIYEQLDDLKKVVLSDAMPLSGTHADKTEVALCSEAYKKHLEGLSEARRRANEAKVRYGVASAKFDALRTIISSRRELFKRGVE